MTPSGTNTYRGGAYVLQPQLAPCGANRYFNNRDGIEKPYLNRNQFGGTFGGPVFKNKLFFFGYYEAFRQKNEATPNNRIPRTTDFGDGVFRYRGLDGVQRSINVLQTAGLAVDPRGANRTGQRLRGAGQREQQRPGDGLNTGGYRFNQQDLNNRDQFGTRFDYTLNAEQPVRVHLHAARGA